MQTQCRCAKNDLDRAMDRAKLLIIDSESIPRSSEETGIKGRLKLPGQRINIAEWNLEQQTLKSPIDGVVLDRPTPLRTRVAVNDPIMRVADVCRKTW